MFLTNFHSASSIIMCCNHRDSSPQQPVMAPRILVHPRAQGGHLSTERDTFSFHEER